MKLRKINSVACRPLSRVAAVVLVALAGACHPKGPSVVKPHKVKAAYAVGSEQINFVDQTRSTPANGAVASVPSRSLVTDVWYPALADSSASETVGAPLDPGGAPYPLVLFVHGSTGLSRQSTFLTQGLAAKGYVVAAANFPLTTITQPGGSSDLHSDMQVGDLSFLADRFAALAAKSNDPLYEAISPSDGYAVVGHSTGGTVALDSAYAFAHHDDRVQAIVALAPCACFFAESFFKTRRVPMLVIVGTNDAMVPPLNNGERAFSLSTSPRWLALLHGGTHLYFTGFNVSDGAQDVTHNDSDISMAFAADGAGGACSPIPPLGTEPLIDFSVQHSLTVQLTQAFLDDQMFGDPSLLDAMTASPDPHIAFQHAGQ